MNTSDSKEYNHLKGNFWLILITFNLVFIITALIIGYSHKDYSASQKENARLIGASYMTMNNEFYKIMSEEINARVEAEGDKMVLCDPALDADRQAEQIVLPRKEWTWDEFYEICAAVTKDTDKNGVLDQFGVVNYTWKDALDSNGTQLFNAEGTECFLSDEKVETAIVFMEKLQKINNGYPVMTKDFDLGNVVFQPMSFSQYRAYKPYPLSIKKYSGFEWECIPMPAGPSGENISTLDTLLLAMNENTPNEQYAWDLMKVLTCDTQIQRELFDYSEGVSVLREVTKSEDTLKRLMEGSGEGNILSPQILSDAVENAVLTARFRNDTAAMDEADKAISAIIEGSSNIRMELIIWNRKLNQLLKE